MSGRLGMVDASGSRGDAAVAKAQGNKGFMIYQAASGTRARVRRPEAARRFRELAHPALGLPPQNVRGWARRAEDPVLNGPGRLARQARASYQMREAGVGRAGVAPRGMRAPSATVDQQMGVARRGGRVNKAATLTMSDAEAHRLAARYDTKGPLPKGLSRDQKMKAYEGRYIAAGGRKAERWKRRANAAEVGRNVGLVGATTSAAALLAARGKRTGPVLRKTRLGRAATPHRLETAALGSALGGGWSELYGEHARSRRASYQNSPAGVAGSALSRMQAYTPEKKR